MLLVVTMLLLSAQAILVLKIFTVPIKGPSMGRNVSLTEIEDLDTHQTVKGVSINVGHFSLMVMATTLNSKGLINSITQLNSNSIMTPR